MKKVILSEEMLNSEQLGQVAGGDVIDQLNDDIKLMHSYGIVITWEIHEYSGGSRKPTLCGVDKLQEAWKEVGVDLTFYNSGSKEFSFKYFLDGHELTRDKAWKMAADYYISKKK